MGTELNPLFSSRRGMFVTEHANGGVTTVGFFNERASLLSVLYILKCGHVFRRGAGYTKDTVCICKHK